MMKKSPSTQGEHNNSLLFPQGPVNTWDLKLGTQKPLALDIEAGAYKSTMYWQILLSEMNIEDGASQSKKHLMSPINKPWTHSNILPVLRRLISSTGKCEFQR